MPDKLNFKHDRYCQEDRLGFDQYIDVLADMIRAENFQTPFCFGLYGKRGSGKTSFMHLLEKKLQQNGGKPPYPITVWFNPWRYEKEEHLIIPFLKTIEQALKNQEKSTLPAKILGGIKKAGQAIHDAAAAIA